MPEDAQYIQPQHIKYKTSRKVFVFACMCIHTKNKWLRRKHFHNLSCWKIVLQHGTRGCGTIITQTCMMQWCSNATARSKNTRRNCGINYYELKWTCRVGVEQCWLLPNIAEEYNSPLQNSLNSYERFRLLVSSHRERKNEYFCNMVVVIASVEQCHGICHRNISLKASLLLFMLKKRKWDTYFLFRNAYVQSRHLLSPALPALLRSCCSVRAAVHLSGQIPSTPSAEGLSPLRAGTVHP